MNTVKVVLYDVECAYCRGFVSLLKKLDKQHQFRSIPYDDHESQRLLREQFDSKFGFSMYVFDQDQVCWGRAAAQKILSGLSLPAWLSQIAFYTYPALVKAVSKLTGRTRAVCGPECLDRTLKTGKSLCIETRPAVQASLSQLAHAHQR